MAAGLAHVVAKDPVSHVRIDKQRRVRATFHLGDR